MALSIEENEFLKRIYQKLSDKPLQPDDPLYEPIYEHEGCEDPVDLMQTRIEFSEVESVQMFSGFRGSGKTTELLRLKQRLEAQGCVVLYGDALDYLNPAEPIDIADLLIVVAGAFSDTVMKLLGTDPSGESYWVRIKNYLTRTSVDVTEATVKTEIATPTGGIFGALKAGVDLKLALKTAPSFRMQLQDFMANRLGDLTAHVQQFFEDGVRAIRRDYGPDTRIVFIFDSLEQLRGSLTTEQDVIRSVERVFVSHLEKLNMPYIHMVYTVPPWLKFVVPAAVNIVMIPSVRQWENNDTRTEWGAGWDALRSLVRKRFSEEGCTRCFGSPDSHGHHPQSDQLIAVCGGDFRDLLRLFREALVRAKSLPVGERVIEAAISSVRSNFLPIAIEDALWLSKIAQSRSTALLNTSSDAVHRLTRFLDTHFVLYIRNGEEWYDVHPLIRDEVAKIVAQQSDRAEAGLLGSA